MKHKIVTTGTVTWISYNNLGTVLQAYALQRVVNSLGYRNEIISDEKILAQQNHVSFISRIRSNWRRLFSFSFYRFSLGKRQSNQLFNKFKSKYLKINNSWTSEGELQKRYDIFICGSDQIWSSILPLNLFYYLGFTTKPKIAYAPSIGVAFFPESRKKIVKPYLEDFSNLSVREEIGKNLIASFINKHISVVLDPTLLLDQLEWRRLIPNTTTTKKKVLCYFLTFNKKYIESVSAFAKQKRLPLYIVITDQRFIKYADCSLYIGPAEFISEISSASYIFTDSFHGTVFSILFNKKFLTFERFSKDASNNQNSRIYNLLNRLELTDCLIKFEDFAEKLSLPYINYEKVSKNLDTFRSYSLDYLKNALEDAEKHSG